ncbi:MAG: NAD(P)/FAD-dependent oxidoreductase [Syntrophales bacterium]
MVLKINGLALSIGEGEELLRSRAASLLGVPKEAVIELTVIRRSIDARRSRPPHFVYLVNIRLADGFPFSGGEIAPGVTVEEATSPADETGDVPSVRPIHPPERRPVVVGSGPAGLFAALILAMKGVPVLLLERGKAVPERLADVRLFWEQGILNPESHVHFGEGGAGTFSDGKLTSRVKNPYTAWVKRILVDMGAPADILVDARPHIGTDCLRAVVVNLRNRLLEMGCEVRFGAQVTDLIIRRGRLEGLVVNSSEEIRTGQLLLAIGQAADDTYRKLEARGVALAAKPFAVGLRVEHPQEIINRIQYGKWSGSPGLPPADYLLTAKVAEMNRSVYSFCMCPGGQVIGCSAEPGGVITNGMSRYHRDTPYANSAVVVNVRVEDLGGDGPLAGLAFRRRWEEKAFLAGGGDYSAPVQRLTAFTAGRQGSSVTRCSYLPGIREAELRDVLPPFVVAALKRGFGEFERKMPGFVTGEATLIGVETRTSSPVRVVRGNDGQSVNVAGLFPCGEGAGYAGGIISSSLDGIRAAEFLVSSLG